MNKLNLIFLAIFISVSFAFSKDNLSKPICKNPSKSGSVEHSSGIGALLTLGLSTAGKFQCAFYLGYDGTVRPDCSELLCRAQNRSIIVKRGNEIIKLSNKLIDENTKGISKPTLRRGISKIQKEITKWNVINYNFPPERKLTAASAKSLEKVLTIPLEKSVNELFLSWPLEVQNTYKIKAKEAYEAEQEKKRLAAEKKLKEQQKKKQQQLAIKLEKEKEKRLTEIKKNQTILYVLLSIVGLFALWIIFSRKKAFKELKLSEASKGLGSKDSFFRQNNININQFNEVNNLEEEETSAKEITGKERTSSDNIEIVNCNFDIDPSFDLDLIASQLSSFGWDTFRQVLVAEDAVVDSLEYPNKKVYLFNPESFAIALKMIPIANGLKKKTKDDGEEYFGDSKDIDAYQKISDDISLLGKTWKQDREELINSFTNSDTEVLSLRNETKNQNEREALSIELLEKLKENREKFRKFESDTIKEVELIIYRSELSEEFKKKLIDTLPEALGLLG
tara:strand:- start:423 stop:1943 length:1521 start_codon:yes stop_codon:yes gene_type:complete